MRRLDSRAAWTAGNTSANSSPKIETTTNNSIRLTPARLALDSVPDMFDLAKKELDRGPHFKSTSYVLSLASTV